MKWFSNIRARKGKRYLRDYVRLVIAFYGCLLVLGIYQQLGLYGYGVLDSLLNQNLLLLWMHHLGFTAVVSLLFSYVFRFLEKWRPGWGFRICMGFFMLLLLAELVLTEYFIMNYELAGDAFMDQISRMYSGASLLLTAAIGLMVLGSFFRIFYRASKRYYRIISGMYPVTLVLFSLFLATLWSAKRPVNRNKTEYLAGEFIGSLIERDVYQGDNPYPLYSDWEPADPLGPYLDWPQNPPNIVIIAVEGLGGEFVGERAPFALFTPFLDSLRSSSLFWEHFLGNVRESRATLPVIMGSLPQSAGGVLSRENNPNDLSVFSLLKKNGYRTSFQYGGNAALAGWDRFLYGERVDEVSDQKAFGDAYTLQEVDQAGISLGFPDSALFERYLRSRPAGPAPRLDYLQTLSSARPYLFPQAERYLGEVWQEAEKAGLDRKQSRILRRNERLIAALHYTDDRLREFFEAFRKLKTFGNTVFIITGTHHPGGLVAESPATRYHVPLLIYSPLLKKAKVFRGISSHMDLAPSLLGSLTLRYSLEMPEKAAWLGGSLTSEENPGNGRDIPLYRRGGEASGIIRGSALISDGIVYRLGPGLNAVASDIPETEALERSISDLRATERYAVTQNALIPPEAVPFENLIAPPGRKDLVWVHSVFNGRDFDNAFRIARNLALHGSRERAITLCHYILSEVPGHVDTEILLGRIHAWEGRYGQATGILERVVQKYPVYPDGYSALLDVYYWSGQNEKALYLQPSIESFLGKNRGLQEKLQRASRERYRAVRESSPVVADTEIVKNQFK